MKNENEILWKIYNKAFLIDAPPHITIQKKLKFNEIKQYYKKSGRTKSHALFSIYPQYYDCPFETAYWYIVKDNALDLNLLASKERYEIRKGTKRFEVKKINPSKYIKEIYEISKIAFSTYGMGYRPDITEEKTNKQIRNYIEDGIVTYGAFLKSGIDDSLCAGLCGFLHVKSKDGVITLIQQKALPEYEKHGLNAALIYCLLMEHKDLIEKGKLYICDGGRAIRHKTGFQDYLEKYFKFRKAYSVLCFVAPWYIKVVLLITKPFKALLSDDIPILYNLKMVHEYQSIAKQTERQLSSPKLLHE
jgi:hypothetical protein